MSGEGGGAILGGLLLIGAMPYILAGAAIVGCAAGAVALGSTAVKAGVQHHKGKKWLEVEHCSQELSKMYQKMQAAMDRQCSLNTQYYQTVKWQMEQLSGQLQQKLEGDTDSGQLGEMLQHAKRESAKALGAARRGELERIRRETQAELSSISAALEAAQKEKLELLDWKAETAAARAQQKALAQDILRDAKAVLQLLLTLAESSREEQFSLQVETMQRSFQTAQAAFNNGAFQQAAASGQRIISRGSSLALNHEQKLLEADEIRTALEARLEGLKAELAARRMISFEDEFYGHIEEDLDDFTQEEFSRVQERVQALLDRVHSEESAPAQLELLLAQVEDELVPSADRVAQIGGEKLLGYYERLHALQIVGGYMQEQGYKVTWIQPAGGDVTQKLAVQFQEPISGNTISVALDEDASVEDVGRMAMEVMFYYQNGRPLTEIEKQSIRDGMLGALRSKGLDGALGCTGCINQAAEDKRLESAEAVQSIQPKPIFREETVPYNGQN